jgi:hypothetical protein
LVGIGPQDNFGDSVGHEQGRGPSVLPQQLHAQDVAVIPDGAGKRRHAKDDSVDAAKHGAIASWPGPDYLLPASTLETRGRNQKPE